MLPSYNVLSPSISSSLETHLQSTPLTSKALEAHLLLFSSTPSYSFNLLYSSYRKLCISPVPLSCDQEARIRREQCSRAECLCQQVFWVLDSGINRLAFLHKSSGMLYFLDTGREDWTSAFDGACLTQVLKRGDPTPRPPQARELTDSEVELPRSLAEFPGFDQGLHERPRYKYSDVWQQYVTARVQAAAVSLPPQHQSTSSTLLDTSPVASLKAPHRPLTFSAPSMVAPGAVYFPAFNTPPTFASRHGECKSSILASGTCARRQLLDLRAGADGSAPTGRSGASGALGAASRARSSPDESCAPKLKPQQQCGDDEPAAMHAWR